MINDTHREETVFYSIQYKNIHNKLVELEGRSRRNNLRIDGIKEHNKESWEECERRVHSMLKEWLDRECGEQLFVNSYDLKTNKTF